MTAWTPEKLDHVRRGQYRGEDMGKLAARANTPARDVDVALWVKLGRPPARACAILNGIARPVMSVDGED